MVTSPINESSTRSNGKSHQRTSRPLPSTIASSANRHERKTPLFATISFVAGGSAGCAAKTVIAPLDRIKILFQASSPSFTKFSGSWAGVVHASKDIVRNHGVQALYQGHLTTLLKIFPYAAIKFMAYEEFRAILMPTREEETNFRRLVAGSLAGVSSVLATYPLELIRVRQAVNSRANRQHTLRAAVTAVYNETPQRPGAHRLTNFYRGFIPTLWGMIPYAGVSFMVYDYLGAKMQKLTITRSPAASADTSQRPQLVWWATLLRGGIAGTIGQTVAYPLEIVRRRMQVAGAPGFTSALFETSTSTLSTARTIYRTAGIRGFFIGLTIGYLKMTPMSMTSFFVYEWVLSGLKLACGFSKSI